LQSRAQLGFTNAVSSYQRAATLQPGNASAWLQLGQTAQTSGDIKTALVGYKHYLKLDPSSSVAQQIRPLIKQLSPKPSG
jgi:cytochrome c-type biogenesis protein CcmH/NrfG